MNKKYSSALFIFRRDLRLYDNSALQRALSEAHQVTTCFILDPAQVTDKNHYRSHNALQFMAESLIDLKEQCKKQQGHLYIFYGTPGEVIAHLFKKKRFDALFVNSDYTPFSQKRDAALKKVCTQFSVDFISCDDPLLHPPGTILTQAGKPYTIFTPFYKASLKVSVGAPHEIRSHHYYTGTLILEAHMNEIITHHNKNVFVHGGRKEGLSLLRTISEFKDYTATHDYPFLPTTGLAAHLKFGTLSPREVFYSIQEAFGTTHPLIRQLYWRDFYTIIGFYFPHIYGHNFSSKFTDIAWADNPTFFKRWCTGTTGFPLVDAGMRQLNTTGFMHNRVRMVVASFLTKDLHIDWQKGEKYFAQHLIDYDPAVNNGNWQWAASTGCDPQPYFRIFNPWLQQKKFDPECVYIKQWVPELSGLSPKEIHTWYTNKISLEDYPEPIVDHSKQVAYAKKMFHKK